MRRGLLSHQLLVQAASSTHPQTRRWVSLRGGHCLKSLRWFWRGGCKGTQCTPFRRRPVNPPLGQVFVLLCHAWAWFMDLCNVTACSSSYGLRLHQIRKTRISLLLTGRTSVAHIVIQIYSKASVMQGIIYYLWFMWPCPMILLQCTRTLHGSKGSTLPWAPPWPLYCSSSSGHQQVEIMWAT